MRRSAIGRSYVAAATYPAALGLVCKRNVINGVVFPLLLLTGFAADTRSQVSPPRGVPTERPYRVSVDLVVLHATVRDPKGRFAPDLREQDFAVYEDGARQSIQLFRHEDTPVTVGLVVDHSGSMRPKLTDVIAAARTFVRSSNSEDEMFVVNFNEKVTLGLPDAIRFTNRSDELTRAISKWSGAGETALYDAVLAAQKQLQGGNRDKKVLIVISDGADNASAHKLTEVLKVAERSNTLVYTIGIVDRADPDRNPEVLRRLARTTGGEAFFPGRLDEVVEICQNIAHDIRHQYTLGYVSRNSRKPSGYRTIRVVARGEGNSKFIVHTRSGYVAAGESRFGRDEAGK